MNNTKIKEAHICLKRLTLNRFWKLTYIILTDSVNALGPLGIKSLQLSAKVHQFNTSTNCSLSNDTRNDAILSSITNHSDKFDILISNL